MICTNCNKPIISANQIGKVGHKGEVTCTQCVNPIQVVDANPSAVSLLRTGMGQK